MANKPPKQKASKGHEMIGWLKALG